MTSWSSQPLPSGSLNDASAKYERPGADSRPGGRCSKHLADVHAAADEIGPGGVDVLDHQFQTLNGARLGCRDALAEVDRALRARRRELHRPEVVAGGKVGVQPPSEALIEALCPIDIGDGQRHDLELHVDGPHFRDLRRGIGARVGAAHADLRPVGGAITRRRRAHRPEQRAPTTARASTLRSLGCGSQPRARFPGRPSADPRPRTLPWDGTHSPLSRGRKSR